MSVNCREALEQLYELLDQELTGEREEEVRKHLDLCRRCYPHLEFERAFQALLAARCARTEAPESLRRRILEELLEEAPAGGACPTRGNEDRTTGGAT